MENINEKLIKLALESREKSYSPYSNFKVGSALITDDGSIYTGTNIENASYTPTICAERLAIFKAVFDGKRKINKIAVVGKLNDYTFPCGVCRQVIREFADEDCEIIVIKNEKEYKIFKFKEILPHSFGGTDL